MDEVRIIALVISFTGPPWNWYKMLFFFLVKMLFTQNKLLI